MDALERDFPLLDRLRPSICVEVGSGSGAVITFLATHLGSGAFYLTTDVNPKACRCTYRTLLRNGVQRYDCINEDLVNGFQPRLRNNVDVLIFNPPYVPTPSEDVWQPSKIGGIEASWAGGARGREVTDRLLPDVAALLSRQGVLYLVTVPDNRPDDIKVLLGAQGFSSEVVLSRRAQNEKLSVMRFNR
ncbi:hypothetical protein EMCRGX_G014649 [Ephydatia muelleri]